MKSLLAFPLLVAHGDRLSMVIIMYTVYIFIFISLLKFSQHVHLNPVSLSPLLVSTKTDLSSCIENRFNDQVSVQRFRGHWKNTNFWGGRGEFLSPIFMLNNN